MVEFHGYEIQRDAECSETLAVQKYDEIPMRERDELWKRNSFGDNGEIPMWNRDKYGNAMGLHLQ